MRIVHPVILLLCLLLLGSAVRVLAQSDSTKVPHIENPNTDPIVYCSDSVFVAPGILLQNIQIDDADKGMQVSIVNYE